MAISRLRFRISCGNSRLIIFLVLILDLLAYNGISLQNPDSLAFQAGDSIVFRQFDGSIYRASSFNYMSTEDQDGIMYFGNENGLLEFDGTHWELHRTPTFSPVTFLKIIGDKIYTYGTVASNELGYFQRDSKGHMMYHSLSDRIPDEKELSFIANIVEHNGDVYFGSDSSVLKWDGEILKRIQSNTNLAIYKVKNELLVSLYGPNGGLAKMEDDTLRIVNSDFKFTNDYVWELLKNEDDEWLIFTSENGIYEFDPKSYETKVWQNETNEFFRQDSIYLYYVTKYRDSLFISSTWENGVLLFDEGGNIIRELDKKAGLLSNYTAHPKADRRGNLWLSSGYGIQYLQFFDPAEKFSFEPLAKVRYIKLGDSSVFIRDSDHVISLSEKRTNSVDFYFSVPSFFSENLEFSYYLEGFEDGWSDWTNNSRKEYTNLPGGEYIFHLRARNISNQDLKIRPFEFTIIVPLKWYENYVTYVALGALVALMIFGFIRYRTHRLSLANRKLESIVKERTSELRSQKERLKEANEELKTINNELDNFVYRSSHDLVAPLKSLRGLISVAGMSNNPDEIKQYFTLMNVSITKLEEFIKSIMDFSTNTKKPLEMKLVKMDTILDSIVEDLKFYENADKVELVRAYDSDFEIRTDPKRINIVLSNLVTNALKYHDFKQDDPQYIKVSAKIQDKSYVIEVEDNGSGIPEEYQSKIFDMFFRAHQGTEGSGLGLYIVVDTLNVLKGAIGFTSKSRVGTTFRVTLPLVD